MSNVRPIWQILVSDHDVPLTCHECGAILTYLADLGAGGMAEPVLWAMARQHLERCPDCADYFRQQVARLEALYFDEKATP